MTGDSERVATVVGRWLAEGQRLLVMTDFDGTLVPIVDDPEQARLDPDVRGALDTLAQSPHTRVAVVSGRSLEDLRERVAVKAATYAGCYGLEIAGPDFAFSHPDAEAQQHVLHGVGVALSERAPMLDGLRVEPKRLGVAVHYRHLDDDARRRLEHEMARAIQQDGARLKIFHGTKVIEILPAVDWTLARCAELIVERTRRELGTVPRVLYLGDDWIDEPLFEALAGHGVTVRVGDGDRASKAAYRFERVEQVHELLATLADHVSSR